MQLNQKQASAIFSGDPVCAYRLRHRQNPPEWPEEPFIQGDPILGDWICTGNFPFQHKVLPLKKDAELIRRAETWNFGKHDYGGVGMININTRTRLRNHLGDILPELLPQHFAGLLMKRMHFLHRICFFLIHQPTSPRSDSCFYHYLCICTRKEMMLHASPPACPI